MDVASERASAEDIGINKKHFANSARVSPRPFIKLELRQINFYSSLSQLCGLLLSSICFCFVNMRNALSGENAAKTRSADCARRLLPPRS